MSRCGGGGDCDVDGKIPKCFFFPLSVLFFLSERRTPWISLQGWIFGGIWISFLRVFRRKGRGRKYLWIWFWRKWDEIWNFYNGSCERKERYLSIFLWFCLQKYEIHLRLTFVWKILEGELFQQFQGNDFQGNKWKRGD